MRPNSWGAVATLANRGDDMRQRIKRLSLALRMADESITWAS